MTLLELELSDDQLHGLALGIVGGQTIEAERRAREETTRVRKHDD